MKKRRVLSRRISLEDSRKFEYEILGKVYAEKLKEGEELKYQTPEGEKSTGEIIQEITFKGKENSIYPDRIIVETDKATYVADDLIFMNENSRRGSWL